MIQSLPTLNFLVFCKNVQRGSGSPLKLDGVFNRAGLPNPTIPSRLEFIAVLSLRMEEFGKTYSLELRLQYPDGREVGSGVDVVGGDKGSRITQATYPMNLVFPCVGTYWFKVYLDGQIVGQSPIDVVAGMGESGDGDEGWPVLI